MPRSQVSKRLVRTSRSQPPPASATPTPPPRTPCSDSRAAPPSSPAPAEESYRPSPAPAGEETVGGVSGNAARRRLARPSPSSGARVCPWSRLGHTADLDHQVDHQVGDRGLWRCRPAREQHRHQPGVRRNDRLGHRRRTQDRRGQRRRHRPDPNSSTTRGGWSSTASPSTTGCCGYQTGPGYRDVRREQGDAHARDPGACGRVGLYVRVNAVAPAVVKTRFAEALYEGKEKEDVELSPRAFAVPEEDRCRLASCFEGRLGSPDSCSWSMAA